MNNLECIRLGESGPRISRLGMGCWAIGEHGWGAVNGDDSIRAVQCALEEGVTFFDTADVYGLGHSESLLSRALGSRRHDVVIATKGGVRWNDSREVWNDISPVYLRQAVEASLRRLDIERIPLYYIHKPDGRTPVAESVAALELLRQEGKIGAIGVSNMPAALFLEALQNAPISALQVRLNMLDKRSLTEYSKICRENNVTLVAWGALAEGLLTGKFTHETTFAEDDHRSRMPDFSGDLFLKNLECVEQLRQWAACRGVRLAELALRWVLDSSPLTAPLFGAKTESQVLQNLGSSGWGLTAKEMDNINRIVDEYRG